MFNNVPSFQCKYCRAKQTYANAYLDDVERNDGRSSSITISNDGGKPFGDTSIVPISSPRSPYEPHATRLSSGALVSTCRQRDVPCGVKAMFGKDRGETPGYRQYRSQ